MGAYWSTSLKSLWVGEGEAIGDIAVGDELAEHLGSEPIHPVLLDLCTGVAPGAYPTLLAAEQVAADLFLPLRYGRVVLRERMPRRFYCRARWQTGDARQRDAGLRSRFRRSGWPPPGRNSRVHGETRAPGGVVARARRRCHPAAVHPRLARGAAAGVERRRRKRERHLADCRIRRTGGQPARLHLFRPDYRSGALGQLLAQAQERGVPVSGIVWRSTGPSAEESSAEFAARLETEIANLLSAVHTLQGDEVKLPGGLWIITERAVATESGEPVDPVQAALWGLGRTIINEEPALRCRLVDYDGSEEAVHSLAGLLGTPIEEPELALRQGKFLVSRLLPWARGGHLAVPRATDYVLAPTERGAIDNLRLTETEVPPPDAGRCRSGWRPLVSTSGMCSMCSASTRAIRGRSAVTSPASSHSWVAASPDSRSANASSASCRERSPAGSMCRF